MKKLYGILAILLICAVLITDFVPINAAQAVSFTSLKGVDYIQLRENTTDAFGTQTAYNFDLQILKNDGMNNAYTATVNNPFTFGDLDSMNAAWENVTAAYCLEHSLGYPHSTDYINYTSFNEYFKNAFDDEETRNKAKAGVLSVMTNGYPNNKEYWSDNGVSNYGAQLYATQVAVWYVLTMYGGKNNTGVFNGYTNVEDFYRRFIDRPDGATVYARTNPKYEGIEGLIDMLIYLKDIGMSQIEDETSFSLVTEPVGSVSVSGDNFVAQFAVEISSPSKKGYDFNVRNILGEYEVYLNNQKIEGLNDIYHSDTCNGRDIIKLIFKRAYNASKHAAYRNVYLDVLASAGLDTSNIKCYHTDALTVDGIKRQKIMLASFEEIFEEDGAAQMIPIEGLGIRLTKTASGSAQLLSGAKFGIYAAENVLNYDGSVIIAKDTLIEEIITGENGNASTTKDYPYGMKCYIKELEAPFGYIPSTEIKYVTMTSSGIVVDFENEEQKGDINIYKTGEKLKGYENGKFVYEKQLLSGAKYAITDTNGNILQEVITNEDGFAVAKNLPLGTYYVKEIEAPYGYVLSEETVIAKLEYDRDIYGNVSTTLNLENDRIKVGITINKYASDTGTTLAGAEFTVYSGDTPIEKLITDDSGIAFSNLDYPLGEYMVCETNAPAKYKLNTTPIRFMATDENNTFEFKVYNEPIIGEIFLSYGENGDDVGGDNPPKTRDAMNIWPYIVSAAIALLVLILLLLVKKKKTFLSVVLMLVTIMMPINVSATENNERNMHVIETVYYNSCMTLLDVPKSIEVVKYDKELEEDVSGSIPYSKTECVRSYWQDDFTFELKFSRNDAAYYELGDVQVSNIDDLYEHKDYIISLLNLDKTYYKIDSFEWKEGTNQLVAVAKGKRLLSDFAVIYEGDLLLSPIDNTNVQGTIDLENVENVSVSSAKVKNETPLIMGGVIVLIFLLVFFIIHMLHKKRRYCILKGSCV